MSAERLRKIANVIASNASNAYRKGPAPLTEAIGDWESDLSFLKRKYYVGARLAFEWPSVQKGIGTDKASAGSLT
jgi:hypothetical protein